MALLSSYTDEQLLPLLATGDEAAYAEIYNRYVEKLVTYAAHRLSSLDEARDIIQDIFVSFWQQRQAISIHTSLTAYFFTAVRYRIISRYRQQGQQQKYVSSLRLFSDSISENDIAAIEAKDICHQLENSINQLEPRAKEIYELSRQHHLSIAEIATRLNISERTVKNQLTTALHHLRPAMDKLIVLVFVVLGSVIWCHH